MNRVTISNVYLMSLVSTIIQVRFYLGNTMQQEMKYKIFYYACGTTYYVLEMCNVLLSWVSQSFISSLKTKIMKRHLYNWNYKVVLSFK